MVRPMFNHRPRRGSPILYWFLVSEVPEGGAPVQIRREWVGVPLPVRRPRPVEGPVSCVGRDVLDRSIRHHISDAVMVEFDDALRALRLFGRSEAADWWHGLLGRRLLRPALAFRTHEGRLLPPGYARMLFAEIEDYEPS